MPPTRRKLPIGVQTFAQIVSEDYYFYFVRFICLIYNINKDNLILIKRQD